MEGRALPGRLDAAFTLLVTGLILLAASDTAGARRGAGQKARRRVPRPSGERAVVRPGVRLWTQ
ncbi:hypothetical protein SAT01_18750 [Sinomonas atrocyanea]|nr:hypothetical protein SAT01_18750 [Sinomonas atrocyanea]GGG62965.1 hypothetical protein GCM10007172_12710 [Sinomonas atrocyanea]